MSQPAASGAHDKNEQIHAERLILTLLTVAVTIVFVLLAANLSLGNKPTDRSFAAALDFGD